jgi:hypothetical protein
VTSIGLKGGLALKPLWQNTTWLWFLSKTLPTKVNAPLSGTDGSAGPRVRHSGELQEALLDKADVYISRPVMFWTPPAVRSMLILQISTLKGKETVTWTGGLMKYSVLKPRLLFVGSSEMRFSTS